MNLSIKKHEYTTQLTWTGNLGVGTQNYSAYKRDFDLSILGKVALFTSADPAFLGDPTKHNPEELFLSSVSSCHALWYLHLCSANQIVVHSYRDKAKGVMHEEKSGKGQFTEIILYPNIVIEKQENIAKAMDLHTEANRMCFIANSLNFDVRHEAVITT